MPAGKSGHLPNLTITKPPSKVTFSTKLERQIRSFVITEEMEESGMNSHTFKLVIVGIFFASAASTATFFELSGINDHQPKAFRLTAMRHESAPIQSTQPQQHKEPAPSVESELARAKSLMNAGKFAEAETVYTELLNNHELLEIHDPLRVNVCQQYANLLNTLGRNEEAQRILRDSEQIYIRPEKDSHPARAHIS